MLVVVLLFGAKRLPDAARSVGRSLRIFKAETKGLVDSEVVPRLSPPARPTTPAAAGGRRPEAGPGASRSTPEPPAPPSQA